MGIDSNNIHKRLTFGYLFRPTFVIFCLYLARDAFHRWDGFNYYASFNEFLPSVALALILWSLVSVAATLIVLIIIRSSVWFCSKIGWMITADHLLFFILVCVLFGALVWKIKILIWPDVKTNLQLKLIVLICTTLVTILFTILTRSVSEKWSTIIQDHITPLVWMFGIFVFLSVPLVAYYTWFNDSGKAITEKKQQFFTNNSSRPNVILVTFDALAARDMSVYAYHKETTPFITRWAKNATVFTRAESAGNFTTPAVASLMTGKRVWTHQTYHIEGTKPVRSDIESMPSVLKNNGYFNIALVASPFASVKVLGISESFDIAPLASELSKPASLFGWKFGIVDVMLYRVFSGKIRFYNWIFNNEFIFSRFLNLISRNVTRTEVPPELAFNKLIEIMDNYIPKPFFAWIHVFPPHDPYLPPEPFKLGDNTSMKLRTYKSQEKLIDESYLYLFQYQPFPEEMQPAVGLMRDYYDEFIRYCDQQFEAFIEKLNKRPLDNTIIILSSDHGESFEHGYFTHGGPSLYEHVTHVPLIIQASGQIKGQRVNTLVEQIDIPATILGLANIPAPPWMEGRSLVPLMRDEQLPARPAFSMNFEQNRSRGHRIERGSIAVWEGDYKLIHNLERKKSLFFNLKHDPDELDNLIGKEPEVENYLYGLIMTNLKNANEKIRNERSAYPK